MNNYTHFYESHGISPVRQDLSNRRKHFFRREMLYRQLGLPPQAFRAASVLEIGPGSGDNALVTASFAPKRYTLLEPNPTGHEQTKQSLLGATSEGLELLPVSLEHFESRDQYDIVLCEGILPGLDNLYDFLPLLDARVRPGGHLVITCYDAVSIMFETIRRLIALQIDPSEAPIRARAERLSAAFETHLKTLAGMSRSVEDWVLDNLLAPPVFHAQTYFSIPDALAYFGKDYFFSQSSPQFLSNYVWYKELPQDPREFNRPLLEDFWSKWHNLLHYQHLYAPRVGQSNSELGGICGQLAGLLPSRNTDCQTILALLSALIGNVRDLPEVSRALAECHALFEARDFRPERIAHAYPLFRHAFGRGQQYLSLSKRTAGGV
ncbi:MAG: class I SAM-dependent methyltransferase [Burkholderiales bacterium]